MESNIYLSDCAAASSAAPVLKKQRAWRRSTEKTPSPRPARLSKIAEAAANQRLHATLHSMSGEVNPLKSLPKQIEHLAAYATTYRYATTSGNIKPPPDDNTLKPIWPASTQPSRPLPPRSAST